MNTKNIEVCCEKWPNCEGHMDSYEEIVIKEVIENFTKEVEPTTEEKTPKTGNPISLINAIDKFTKCKRSDTWNKIYSIVNQLQLKESEGDDSMDKPSCTTELELLFNKLFIIYTKSTKSI